jgi:hypothetical protein
MGEGQNGARRTKYAEHSISPNLSNVWVAAMSPLPHYVNKLGVFANLNTLEEQFKSYS